MYIEEKMSICAELALSKNNLTDRIQGRIFLHR